MVGYALLTLLVIGGLVWLAAYIVREQAKRHQRVDEELHDARTPTLEYAVPTGQDPAVLLAALDREGYTATVDPRATEQVVVIKCSQGLEADREGVRAALASGNVTTADDGIPLRTDIRFRDER